MRDSISKVQASLGQLNHFPRLGQKIYWNHAAISPPSLAINQAIQETLDDFALRGSDAFLTVVEKRLALKANLAKLLGAPSSDGRDFAWCPNTTSGVQAIAHAFPWRKKGGVLVFEGEFPTNILPWRQAALRQDIPLYQASLNPLMDRAGVDWSEVESFLKLGVQLLAISAVQFKSGFRVPLKALSKLCKTYDTALFVDGIQACGATPIPLDYIDFMSSGGHKWMMAVEGAGFLYAHPKWHSRLRPQQAGWLSLEEPLDFLFSDRSVLRSDKAIRQEMSAFEGGAQSAITYAALTASVEILNVFGVETIYQHIQELINPLEEGLKARGFYSHRRSDYERQSCILSVVPPVSDPKNVVEWVEALKEYGITISHPDACLRFSPHWPNHVDQGIMILEAIDELLMKPT